MPPLGGVFHTHCSGMKMLMFDRGILVVSVA